MPAALGQWMQEMSDTFFDAALPRITERNLSEKQNAARRSVTTQPGAAMALKVGVLVTSPSWQKSNRSGNTGLNVARDLKKRRTSDIITF